MNLKPGSVHNWGICSFYNTKPFYTEAKFTLAELGRMHQYSGEDLDMYVKCFHEKTMDCCDPVIEVILVYAASTTLLKLPSIYRELIFILIFATNKSCKMN